MIVAAIAVAAGCGQASGGDSVVASGDVRHRRPGLGGSTGARRRCPPRQMRPASSASCGRSARRRSAASTPTGSARWRSARRRRSTPRTFGSWSAAATRRRPGTRCSGRPDRPPDVRQRLVHGRGADPEHDHGRTALVHPRRPPKCRGSGRSGSSRSAGTSRRRRSHCRATRRLHGAADGRHPEKIASGDRRAECVPRRGRPREDRLRRRSAYDNGCPAESRACSGSTCATAACSGATRSTSSTHTRSPAGSARIPASTTGGRSSLRASTARSSRTPRISVCDGGKPGAIYRVAQYDLQQVSARGSRLTGSA